MIRNLDNFPIHAHSPQFSGLLSKPMNLRKRHPLTRLLGARGNATTLLKENKK